MTDKTVPPPLPNAGSATPPPLPKSGATPPPLPVGKASPPPLPTTNAAPPPLPKAEPAPPPIPSVAAVTPPPMPVQQAAPPPVPVAAVIPEAPKVFVPPAPPVQVEASSPTNTSEAVAVQPAAIGKAQQPASVSAAGKSISTGAKLGMSFAAVAALAGVGYGMFGGKGADVPHSERQAATPVPASAPSVTPAPVAPVPSPNAVDEKDDKIRQLESKLAEAELEKQRALQAAEQRKSSERPAPSAPRTAPAPVAPMPATAAAPAPVPAVQYQPPQHSGVTYRAESRAQGESCNSHSDCQGELKCFSGQCVANTGGQVSAAAPAQQRQQNVSVPKNAKHLVGAYYLFKDSVKDLGNGYRGIYAYLNDDVPVGQQYHGQVRSQVARYVMNCQAAQFGMDQVYFFSQPNAQGQRVAGQEWQPNQVAFNPIQNAMEHIRKSYDFACRK